MYLRLLLLLLLPPCLVPHTGEQIGTPVFTEWHVARGDTLFTVITADVHEEPSRGSPVRMHLGPGAAVLPKESRSGEAGTWIGTDAGWIEAARLDLGARAEVDPEPGRERMAARRPLPSDYRPPDLVSVPDSLKAPGYEGRSMKLRPGALEALTRLIADAGDAGYEVRIVSAFRSASYQRKLYAKAVDRDPAQNHSAAPGRSEHQLGTTVDVAVAGVRAFHPSLAQTPAGRWLAENAPGYGIVQPFGAGTRTRREVMREPWHLRWVAGQMNEAFW